MKKTFNLTGIVTVSVHTSVEADTLEEAIQIAQERDIQKYNYCNKWQEKEAWVNEDYDGEVLNIIEE